MVGFAWLLLSASAWPWLAHALSLCKLAQQSGWLDWRGCISHHEAADWLRLRRPGLAHPEQRIAAEASLDLGRSRSPLLLGYDGVYAFESSYHNSEQQTITRKDVLSESLIATWEEISAIASDPHHCYALYGDGSKPWKVSTVSSSTRFPALLLPSPAAGSSPTMVLGGFTMHRIAGEGMNPTVDTAAKLSAVRIRPGDHVLDTCMGLGYTAIGAAKLGGLVTSFEHDHASVEMAAHNPWSAPLFDGSLAITAEVQGVHTAIATLLDRSFDVVLHDPPARAICKTDLYGEVFYRQLRRVLKPGGQLYHYIGNPRSKESGSLYKGVKQRLLRSGFAVVEDAEDAFGVTAF